MVAQADDAYERKLKQAVRKRLDAGQDPGAVLIELKARLDPAQAEAIFADASRTPAPAKPRRARSPRDRALLVPVMIWAALLLFQNVTVIATAAEALGVGPSGGPLTRELGLIIFFAGMKILLLLVSAIAADVARSSLRFPVFAAAILYAHPLGVLIEHALTGRTDPPWPAVLLGVSALFSYASAAALVVLWRRARSKGLPPAEDCFD